MRGLFSTAVLSALLGGALVAQGRTEGDAIDRIRNEGLMRSRALALFRTITDEHGARLTGSPAHLRSARWARDRFEEWGLVNAHLEPYGDSAQ